MKLDDSKSNMDLKTLVELCMIYRICTDWLENTWNSIIPVCSVKKVQLLYIKPLEMDKGSEIESPLQLKPLFGRLSNKDEKSKLLPFNSVRNEWIESIYVDSVFHYRVFAI